MQITVKSAKVAKTGTKDNREWRLIIITSDDGTDYATFHTSAEHITPGSVIDIGEPKIKEGKVSFKEFTVISAAPAPAVIGNTSGINGMTPELWAEKDKADRWSKECNTCFMGIMELVGKNIESISAGKAIIYIDPVFTAALDWALNHFTNKMPAKTSQPSPEATKSKSEKPGGLPWPEGGVAHFKDRGEFYTACNKQFKLQKSGVDKEVAGIDLTTDAGRLDAWAKIVTIYGGPTDAEIAAKKTDPDTKSDSVKEPETPGQPESAEGQGPVDPEHLFS